MMRLTSLAVAFLLIGCALNIDRPEPVPIGDGAHFGMSIPPFLSEEIQVAQIISINSHERNFLFEARVSVTPQAIKFVSFDAMGRQAVTFEWRENGLQSETADWLPHGISAPMLAVHLAIIYWPDDIVRAGLIGDNLTLVETGNLRRIRSNKKDLLTIEYQMSGQSRWQGIVRFRNMDRDYELQIRSKILS